MHCNFFSSGWVPLVSVSCQIKDRSSTLNWNLSRLNLILFSLAVSCSACVDHDHSHLFCAQRSHQQFQLVHLTGQTLCLSFPGRCFLLQVNIQMEADSTWIFPKECWRCRAYCFFVKIDLPITTSGIKNAELCRATDQGYRVIYCPCVVCIVFDSFIQILWIKAQVYWSVYVGCDYNWVDPWCEFPRYCR